MNNEIKKADKVNNYLTIAGRIVCTPEFYKEYNGQKYYSTKVENCRYSHKKNIIPVVIPEKLLDLDVIKKDQLVEIKGEFNSVNVYDKDGKRHTESYIFSKRIERSEFFSRRNEIFLRGKVISNARIGETLSGRKIADFWIIVTRWDGRTDLIRCVAWNGAAEYAAKFKPGRKVELCGRLRSNEYIKQYEDYCEKRTLYEVSIIYLTEK